MWPSLKQRLSRSERCFAFLCLCSKVDWNRYWALETFTATSCKIAPDRVKYHCSHFFVMVLKSADWRLIDWGVRLEKIRKTYFVIQFGEGLAGNYILVLWPILNCGFYPNLLFLIVHFCVEKFSTSTTSLSLSLARSLSVSLQMWRRETGCCMRSVLNLDNMAALMTDWFSLFTGRGVSG